jgi:hypothetical protein
MKDFQVPGKVSSSPKRIINRVMYRQRFDADPDPTFHIDADPDPTPSLHMLGQPEKY